MSVLKTHLTGAIACLIAASFSAMATETGNTVEDDVPGPQNYPLNEWVLTSGTGNFDSADAGDAAEIVYARTRVEVRLEGNVSVFFNCLTASNAPDETVFDAAINLDTTDNEFKKNLRWQFVSGHLTVGDRKKSYRWQWNPANKIMTPTNREASRRMFNAVVKGEPITVRVFGDNYIEQALPKPNADFTAFYKACPALSG